MPHNRRASGATRLTLAITAPLALAFLGGCTMDMLTRQPATTGETTPVVDRQAANATLITSYLETLQRLVLAPPAQQAEIVSEAQREFELAPTPSHQLRFALILATPGHGATDLPRAQRLLRELTTAPATLLPAERALAFLEQQQVDTQLSLEAENRRLQGNAVRNDRDRTAAMNARLQKEIEENARLKKELEAAQAKLDAISDIERSLNERKPSAESRSP